MSQIATLRGNLLREQHGQCSDMQAACTAAAQPKTVSKSFNTHLTKKLLFLCDTTSAHNLPNVWIVLATGNGKHVCETIETHVWVAAMGIGDSNLAPVIAPDLSKKIVGMCLAGNNLDDFTDGINLFLIVVQAVL